VAKGAYSHVVRSQAMHAFLREKRDESHPIADRTKAAKSTEISVAPKTSFSKFKLSTWSRKPNKSKTLPPLQEPNSKALDQVAQPFEVKELDVAIDLPLTYFSKPIYASLHPYSTLPVPITRETELLLYHCQHLPRLHFPPL
jgi:hypothetical protein